MNKRKAADVGKLARDYPYLRTKSARTLRRASAAKLAKKQKKARGDAPLPGVST